MLFPLFVSLLALMTILVERHVRCPFTACFVWLPLGQARLPLLVIYRFIWPSEDVIPDDLSYPIAVAQAFAVPLTPVSGSLHGLRQAIAWAVLNDIDDPAVSAIDDVAVRVATWSTGCRMHWQEV